MTSEPQESSARKVTLTEYRVASGLLPDPNFDGTLSLMCRPNHDELKITAYLNVDEATKLHEREMIGSMEGVVDIFITPYKMDSVWVNFNFIALSARLVDSVRIPIPKNSWILFTLDLWGKNLYIAYYYVLGHKGEVNRPNYLGKF